MIRERRYLVLKLSDVRGALTKQEKDRLFDLEREVAVYREEQGKRPLNTVVVEDDWPEFEPVWKMIEDRVEKEKP